MTRELKIYILECESMIAKVIGFRDQHAPGSDLYLVFDDTVEALYATLDTVAMHLPSPQAGLT